jgi:hypothetical protein
MKYKPNLIDNEPKDGSFTREDRNALITKHGGIEKYIITLKKDGCRLAAGAGPNLLTRSLKQPGSKLVRQRLDRFHQICLTLNIIVDGEFYMHGVPFNHINRFFSKSDVTTPEYLKELTNMKEKKPEAFYEKFRGKDIPFLTTFHDELRFWLFDGIVLDRPDLVTFQDRMTEILARLQPYDLASMHVVEPETYTCTTFDELYALYEWALVNGWEGLILTLEGHLYKFGRSTLKSGTILKLKNDKEEYDGIVLDVEESTVVKDGVDKTINELGRSKTSKKKEDRLPSGMAKGFVVEFEGKGTFCVGLNGFDHAARKEVLDNKEKYIGRHFRYTGMKPLKDFPRHAYFDTWRDEK